MLSREDAGVGESSANLSEILVISLGMACFKPVFETRTLIAPPTSASPREMGLVLVAHPLLNAAPRAGSVSPLDSHQGEKVMLKKIALIGVFAVVSVVSFSSSAVRASSDLDRSVKAPVPRGMCPSMFCVGH
jgi:hypothetical protein